MKKISVLIFVFIMFCFCSISNDFSQNLFCLSSDAKVSFYCDEENFVKDAIMLINGQSFVVETSAEFALETYKNLHSCVGFSIVFNKDEIDLGKILEKVNIIEEEIIEDNFTIYGIAQGLSFSTFVNNKKVNIQIAQNDDFVIIGSPIILGCY